MATSLVGSTGGGSSGEAVLEMARLMMAAQKDERDRMEAKLEAMRKRMESQLKVVAPLPPEQLLSSADLEGFQVRLQRLRETTALSQEEYEVSLDYVADFVELRSSLGLPDVYQGEELMGRTVAASGRVAAAKLKKMVDLATTLSDDCQLARQLRRKNFF
jgi:hypothetical protein